MADRIHDVQCSIVGRQQDGGLVPRVSCRLLGDDVYFFNKTAKGSSSKFDKHDTPRPTVEEHQHTSGSQQTEHRGADLYGNKKDTSTAKKHLSDFEITSI